MFYSFPDRKIRSGEMRYRFFGDEDRYQTSIPIRRINSSALKLSHLPGCSL